MPRPAMSVQTREIEQAIEHLDRRAKLHLIEVLARSLQRGAEPPGVTGRQANLDRLREELEGLPVCNPSDGHSNRDHDALIYGL